MSVTVQRNGNCVMKMDDEISFHCDDTESSISSEEDIATESDFEERIRVRPIQELWNGEDVKECLMMLPEAENILMQLTNENEVFENRELETLLLLASWLGNEKGVKYALEHGQDPNLKDSEGR